MLHTSFGKNDNDYKYRDCADLQDFANGFLLKGDFDFIRIQNLESPDPEKPCKRKLRIPYHTPVQRILYQSEAQFIFQSH